MFRPKIVAVILIALLAAGTGYFYLSKTNLNIIFSENVGPNNSGSTGSPFSNDLHAGSIKKESPAPIQATQPHAQSKIRPIEELLTSRDGLSIKTLQKISDNKNIFDDTLEKIHDGYYADPEATELTRIYGEQIASALAISESGISLKKIACGLSVCGALFDGKKIGQTEFVDLMMNAGMKDGIKIYSSTVRIVSPEPGTTNTNYRTFFSIDPNANKIVIHP